MVGNVLRFEPPGRGGGRDPLRLLSPREAADRMGIGYEAALAFYKRHGMKVGGRHYMTENQIFAAMEKEASEG